MITGSFGDPNFDINIKSDWRMTLPLRAGFNWSISRRWDLKGSYTYQKIGERDGYSSRALTYELKYFY